MEIKVELHIAYVIYLGLGIGLFLVSCGCVHNLNGLTVATMTHHTSQRTSIYICTFNNKTENFKVHYSGTS